MLSRKRQRLLVASTILALVVLLIGLISLSPGASARLGILKTETYIHIGGVNYGILSEVNNLRDLTIDQGSHEKYTRVTIKRDFVTEPSLYLWAHKNAQARDPINRISIVTQTKDGYKIAKYELKNCKPLSWTVETADPTQGGFHEKIELAVQEIAVY